jgi:hypothetical protein
VGILFSAQPDENAKKCAARGGYAWGKFTGLRVDDQYQ